MISTELREIILSSPLTLLVFLFRDQNGPRVTRVGADYHIMVKKCLYTSSSGEHSIYS